LVQLLTLTQLIKIQTLSENQPMFDLTHDEYLPYTDITTAYNIRV